VFYVISCDLAEYTTLVLTLYRISFLFRVKIQIKSYAGQILFFGTRKIILGTVVYKFYASYYINFHFDLKYMNFISQTCFHTI